MNAYILLGPPGSGKGTQAKIIAEKLNLHYIGMGDLIRAEIKKNSEMGQKLVKAERVGALVPNELTNILFKQKIESIGKNENYVIDGYPRSIGQLPGIEEFVKQRKIIVFNIVIAPESVARRLSKRRICAKCGKIYIKEEGDNNNTCDACGGELVKRGDDSNLDSIKERIKVYNDITREVLEYFEKEDLLVNIDGEPDISVVTRNIMEAIDGR